MAVAKEQIRQIISQNNISSVADVYSLLKECVNALLREGREAELDAARIAIGDDLHLITSLHGQSLHLAI